jgi:hypothetical protein
VRGLPTLPSHLIPTYKTLGFDVIAKCFTDHLRVCVKDEFILFMPPENKNNPAEMRSTRQFILDRMQLMITQPSPKQQPEQMSS